MRVATVEVPTEYVSRSSERMTTQRALAFYVRRRWPQNGVKAVQAEWDLTEGQAKGVVYGHASQASIEDIFDHKRGGMGLALHLLEIRFRMRLGHFITREIERLADECHKQQERLSSLAAMGRDWGAVLSLGSGGAVGADRQHPPVAGPEDRRMGDWPDA